MQFKENELLFIYAYHFLNRNPCSVKCAMVDNMPNANRDKSFNNSYFMNYYCSGLDPQTTQTWTEIIWVSLNLLVSAKNYGICISYFISVMGFKAVQIHIKQVVITWKIIEIWFSLYFSFCICHFSHLSTLFHFLKGFIVISIPFYFAKKKMYWEMLKISQ